LFCIREIVGTEKKYQGALKMLLTGQVCRQHYVSGERRN
jgi:hypothetical protein